MARPRTTPTPCTPTRSLAGGPLGWNAAVTPKGTAVGGCNGRHCSQLNDKFFLESCSKWLSPTAAMLRTVADLLGFPRRGHKNPSAWAFWNTGSSRLGPPCKKSSNLRRPYGEEAQVNHGEGHMERERDVRQPQRFQTSQCRHVTWRSYLGFPSPSRHQWRRNKEPS